MSKSRKPDIENLLHVCRQYIYSDSQAEETAAAVHENWDVHSSMDLDARVHAYLSTNKTYTGSWDTLTLHMQMPDAHAKKAFDIIGPRLKEFLRLRTVEGLSIAEIAASYTSTQRKVKLSLTIARAKFWKAYVWAEKHLLRVCRQHVYADNKAAEIAIAVCSKNWDKSAPEALGDRVRTYLTANKLHTNIWDTLALHSQSLDAAASDVHIQKAFDTLEKGEIEFLRLRVVQGHTIKNIAATYKLSQTKVTAVLKDFRAKFWNALVLSEENTLRVCRQYVHSDSQAVEIAAAVHKNWDTSPSPEKLNESVRVYLSTNNPEADTWDTLSLHMQMPDAQTEKAFATLEESEIELLHLRVVQGYTIKEIAKYLRWTNEKVRRSLDTSRTKFWCAIARVDNSVLQECRRLIHDDADAEGIAAAIYKQGYPDLKHLREHLREYLLQCWGTPPDWDNPALVEVLQEVTNPTGRKVPGFHAAVDAYTSLRVDARELLKLKARGLSNWDIARELAWMSLNQVKRDTEAARILFWKTYTSKRWSTLPYFIEKLRKQDASDSQEILKDTVEYSAAEEAYDLLGKARQTLLAKRCVKGHSLKEIAAQEKKSTDEVAAALTKIRMEFQREFLDRIYRLYSIKGEKDDVQEAWTKLQENYYRVVPGNFRAWLTTSTERETTTSEQTDKHRREIENQKGVRFKSEDPEGEGETGIYISTPWEAPDPQDTIVWKEDRDHLKLAHQLLKRTTERLKEKKEPEKKLFLLIKYFLHPVLEALKNANMHRSYDSQDQDEPLATTHVNTKNQGQPAQTRLTQQWIATVIGKNVRTIRRYKESDIQPVLKECCEELGINFENLERACPAIKLYADKETPSKQN